MSRLKSKKFIREQACEELERRLAHKIALSLTWTEKNHKKCSERSRIAKLQHAMRVQFFDVWKTMIMPKLDALRNKGLHRFAGTTYDLYLEPTDYATKVELRQIAQFHTSIWLLAGNEINLYPDMRIEDRIEDESDDGKPLFRLKTFYYEPSTLDKQTMEVSGGRPKETEQESMIAWDIYSRYLLKRYHKEDRNEEERLRNLEVEVRKLMKKKYSLHRPK
jgi:hypothetical protein